MATMNVDEEIDRWGKGSPLVNNDNEAHPHSPASTKKKIQKSQHSVSKAKKDKKQKRSKPKKKKSKKNKSTTSEDRWVPATDSDDAHSLPLSPKSSENGFKSKIRTKSRSKSPPNRRISKSRSRSPQRSSSRSISHSLRSRSRSRSRSNGRKRRYNNDRRYNDNYRQRSREHFTDSPPPRSYYAAKHRYRKKGREQQINHKVIAALNEIQEKHKDDNTHPLDLKQQLKQHSARRKDKAMIWAAASGNFDTEIIKSKQFQKNISLALKTTNKDFDIAVLFKQFSNFSVKLVWLDCSSDRASGIKKSELLTFRDLLSIRSYRKELNHCDALWKFIFYDQRHLFWSMAIYYALLKTTLVPEWDQMFKKQFDLIQKYGKRDYIENDIEALEERKARKEKSSKQKYGNDSNSV